MIDKLIFAYRAQLYDWGIKQWGYAVFKDKPLFLALLVFVVIAVYALIASAVWGIFAIFIGVVILTIMMDLNSIKRHRLNLLNRQQHLKDVVEYLKTVIPEKSLFELPAINSLIERLTERIDTRVPFKNFVSKLVSFVKVVALPVVAYVAGIYSGVAAEQEFTVVVTLAVCAVFLLGVVSIIWNAVSEIWRALAYRDYDAAIALREDLRDIKLLYFTEQEDT